jgi:hypothetical protein
MDARAEGGESGRVHGRSDERDRAQDPFEGRVVDGRLVVKLLLRRERNPAKADR